jgi:hypothetical protein
VAEERLDKLVRTIYAVGGGAAALSMAIFLRSESLELGPDLVVALQLSWLALFYAVGAAAATQFLALFEAPSPVRRLLRRVFVGSAFLAFLLGLIVLAYASVVALADANTEDEPRETQTAI